MSWWVTLFCSVISGANNCFFVDRGMADYYLHVKQWVCSCVYWYVYMWLCAIDIMIKIDFSLSLHAQYNYHRNLTITTYKCSCIFQHWIFRYLAMLIIIFRKYSARILPNTCTHSKLLASFVSIV
jgi:hypothetical protein